MSKFDTHGGYFAPKDYLKVNEGGSHEENPNGGVQIGVDPEGAPNLLEEGEPVYKDYVYSDNINAEREFLEQNHLPGKYEGKLYSKIADDILTEAEERPLDPISRNGLEALLGRLADAQEGQKQAKEQRDLEEELANLSPEELDQLEAMLAEPQAMQGVHPGGDPVGLQGYMGAEDAMAAQTESMPAEGMPMMTNGGLLRMYDMGGPKKTSAEEIASEILARADARDRLMKGASGVNNTDLPLVTEHPDLDLALMIAQPGSVLMKAMAPSAYRGIVNGLTSGEPAYMAFSPFAKFKKADYLMDLADDVYKGSRWGKVRSIQSSIKAKDDIIKDLNKQLKAAKDAKNHTLVRDLEAQLKTQKYVRKGDLAAFEKEFQTASELEPIEKVKKGSTATNVKQSAENNSANNVGQGSGNATEKTATEATNKSSGVSDFMKGAWSLNPEHSNFLQAVSNPIYGSYAHTKTALKNAPGIVRYPVAGLAQLGMWSADVLPWLSANSITNSVSDAYDSASNSVKDVVHGTTNTALPWAEDDPFAAPDTVSKKAGALEYAEEDPFKAFGGKINRANRFDGGGWADFLTALNNYRVSRNRGGIPGTYTIDRGFPLSSFKTIKELEDSDAYRGFTDYVLANGANKDVLDYLRALDAGTAEGVLKLFDGNTLRNNWQDIYRKRRYDQKGGIYHMNPADIAFLSASGSPSSYTGDYSVGRVPQAAGFPYPQPVFSDKLSLPSGPLFDINTQTGYRQEGASLGLPEFTLNNPLQTTPVDSRDPLGREKSKWETSVDGVEIGHPNPYEIARKNSAEVGYSLEPSVVKSSSGSTDEESGPGTLPTWPRYAGAIGSGLLGLYNAFQSPDRYKAPRINPQLPEGRINLQNQVYNPIDQNMVANSIIAQGNATNRALRNSGLGASMASAVLAADNNTTGNLGTGFIQTWDANNQRRNAVIAANNQAEAQRANFDYTVDAARKQILNDAAVRNAQNDFLTQRLNYAAEGDKYTAISNQISNGLQALSGIGKENFAMNQINTNPANLGYRIGPNGEIYYFNPLTRKWEETKVSNPTSSAPAKSNPQFTMNLGLPYNNFSNNPLSRYSIDPFMGYRNNKLVQDKKKTK